MRTIVFGFLACSLLLSGCASSGGSTTPAAGTDAVATPEAKPAGAPAAPAAAATKPNAPQTPKAEPKKSAPPPSRIGDVRVSLFTIGKGEHSKQYAGSYLMLVNPSWVHHKRSYQEPFASVAQPNIKIVEDDVMEALLQHFQDSGFYNMPETQQIDVAAMKRPQVESVRYITLNRDGKNRIIERERVSQSSGLLTKFVDLEFGFNQVWHSSQTFVTSTKKQNWQEAFQGYLELRKAEKVGGEKPAATTPPAEPAKPVEGK